MTLADVLKAFADVAVQFGGIQRISQHALRQFYTTVLPTLPLKTRRAVYDELCSRLVDMRSDSQSRTPRKTVSQSKRLKSERAERAVLSVVKGQAQIVFGSAQKADRWMKRPNPALGHQTPLSLLRSRAGVQRVRTILGRIANGIYS